MREVKHVRCYPGYIGVPHMTVKHATHIYAGAALNGLIYKYIQLVFRNTFCKTNQTNQSYGDDLKVPNWKKVNLTKLTKDFYVENSITASRNQVCIINIKQNEICMK